MKTAPKSVEEYLAAVASDEDRQALERLRTILREELPDAEEKISYGMPGFKQKGLIICYAAFKNHCSFFGGHIVEQFEKELSGFKISKGTVQFKPSNPIPEELVRAMVRARLAED